MGLQFSFEIFILIHIMASWGIGLGLQFSFEIFPITKGMDTLLWRASAHTFNSPLRSSWPTLGGMACQAPPFNSPLRSSVKRGVVDLNAVSQLPSILLWDLLRAWTAGGSRHWRCNLQFSFEIFCTAWVPRRSIVKYPSILLWDLLLLPLLNRRAGRVGVGLQFSFEIFFHNPGDGVWLYTTNAFNSPLRSS